MSAFLSNNQESDASPSTTFQMYNSLKTNVEGLYHIKKVTN